MTKKLLITIGILGVLVIAGIVYATPIGITTPTDTKIVRILEENKENLLSIDGVVGAGIARDADNHIIGIAVYVEDDVTKIQGIPSELGEFKVFVKRISEASEFEKERMIVRNPRYHTLNVTTDKSVYHQNDNITITVRNVSNETVAFGNSAYDLFFEKWNGVSWEFYTGVVGLEVITYLNPEETAEVHYELGGQTDKPFPAGKYQVISMGWLDHNGEIAHVWGCTEFTVE
ncbi:MAG: hypothetical protein ACE5Z5_05165 [Candidatus Bathyarchaeia archaeon]